ncbi:hypothetical protein C922_00476 [Plasmodium inui San Antonio 1]|uniref:Uncharacterized protein n=1 Tax=Plasmodium inui San Antonio 1 TaxID=1237626 RepID=W7ABU4_9APIC|nr:hypothetical protein C922_00476 [Plasmodium inui San Antonio 1]EUD68788.1 hypothetical protein C922_00476 [Plasmodium inui San Antonio 1]
MEALFKELNFAEIRKCVEQDEAQVGRVAKWICANNLYITLQMLAKCKNGGKPNLKMNVMDELDEKISNPENEELLSCTEKYVSLLEKIILHYEELDVETNKKIFEIYSTVSLRVLIFSNHEFATYLQKSLLALIRNIHMKKQHTSRHKNAYSYNLLNCLHNLYFFINLPDFIFLHCLLIYLCSNVNCDRSSTMGKKKEDKLLIHTLRKISQLFERLVFPLNGGKILHGEAPFDESPRPGEIPPVHVHPISDTLNNSDTKIIYKIGKTFKLMYENICSTFDTNKYPVNEIEFQQNYSPENVNVNNFLLLLKIMSPNFIAWVSKEKKKEEVTAEGKATKGEAAKGGETPPGIIPIPKETQTQCYSFKYLYIIDTSQSYPYAKEAFDTIFFFHFVLHALHKMGKHKWGNQIEQLMSRTLNNCHGLLERNYYSPGGWTPTRIFHIREKQEVEHMKGRGKEKREIGVPAEGTTLGDPPHGNETAGGTKLREKLPHLRGDIPKGAPLNEEPLTKLRDLHEEEKTTLLDAIFKNRDELMLKLKSLIIWGYTQVDDVEEWNFLNLANSFIFTDYAWSRLYKKGNYLHEYLFKKNNFFTYNYAVFKSTYECKTLSFKYMDFFSNFVALLVLNMVSALIRFCLKMEELHDEKTNKTDSQEDPNEKTEQDNSLSYETRDSSSIVEGTNPIGKNRISVPPEMDAKNGELTKKCNKCGRSDIFEIPLNELSEDVISGHLPLIPPQTSENVETLFNDFVFICFKLISCPSDDVQAKSLSVLSCLTPNIRKVSDWYIKYMNRKIDKLFALIDGGENDYDYTGKGCYCWKSQVIKNYVHLKCKLDKKININLIKSLQNLINICMFKNYNKDICVIVCKNIITCFYYHPVLFPFLLHKYMNVLFYLMETDDVDVVANSLRCLFLLFQINSENVKIYCHDIVYRLHLLFNIFNQWDLTDLRKEETIQLDTPVKNIAEEYISTSVTYFLKKFYFQIKHVDRASSEILMLMKLILHSIYIAISATEYYQLIRIFSDDPLEYGKYSKGFHTFATF